MDWSGEGTIISVKPHGETSVIINVFTPEQGLHAGLVRGGRSRRLRPILQAGNKVDIKWRARLSEHLGYFNIEPIETRAALIMDNRLSLAALNSITALLVKGLPERQPYPKLYTVSEILIQNLADIEIWPALYVRFEIALLDALGYGLDLSKCAATGNTDNLTHISPRSGRAVSAEAAEPYLEKLMVLPDFLNGSMIVKEGDIAHGLKLGGYFLTTRVFNTMNKDFPEACRRLRDALKTVGIL